LIGARQENREIANRVGAQILDSVPKHPFGPGMQACVGAEARKHRANGGMLRRAWPGVEGWCPPSTMRGVCS